MELICMEETLCTKNGFDTTSSSFVLCSYVGRTGSMQYSEFLVLFNVPFSHCLILLTDLAHRKHIRFVIAEWHLGEMKHAPTREIRRTKCDT